MIEDPKSSSPSDWLAVAEATDYSARLTGNPFLFHESRIILELIDTESDADAIRERVFTANLFQYRTTKSIPKRVNALLVRLAPVPSELRHFIVSAPPSEARKVLVLVLAVRDRLFREFMAEVFAPKLADHDEHITDADFRRYYEKKGEACPVVSGWSDITRAKLKEITMTALIEAGLIDNRKARRILRAVLESETREIIRRWFPPHYVRFLEG